MKSHLPILPVNLLLLLTSLVMCINISAQEFTELSSVSLPGVYGGDAAWLDFDNDGDLDIYINGLDSAGILITKFFTNNGNNTFTEQPQGSIPGMYEGDVAIGDYDNDGFLDLLTTGTTIPEHISTVYRNNGDKTFTDQTGIDLIGVNSGSSDWGDYNKDGYLDILLTGITSTGEYISKVYKNNTDNTFTEQTGVVLTGVWSSSASWVDSDNDGDLDIFLTGRRDAGERFAKIYENNGNNSFTEITGLPLSGTELTAVVWGDYDNDGDQDILQTGADGSGIISKIFRNNGNHSFSEQTGISLTGVQFGDAAWGDYNNDGYLDILLTGYKITVPNFVTIVYKNNGDNSFTEQSQILLDSVYRSAVAWGDYDNDGDLDILLTGFHKNDSAVAKIYTNNTSTANTPPEPPTGLTVKLEADSATLSWNPATDNETPSDGLSYNAYLCKLDSDTIWSSMSDHETGYRKIPAIGNAQQNTSWTINGLERGTYYWSVQAIDHAFAGSAFAPQDTFNNEFIHQSNIKLTGVTGGATRWGDYDNDGDLDILLTGESNGGYVSIVYKNNGDNTFSEQDGIDLTGIYRGSGEWGDYDNDGFLDILLSGDNSSEYISKIYKNNNDSTFSELEDFSVQGVSNSSTTWGDYDNDGDLDFIITGNTGSEYISRIYKNDGDHSFSEQTGIDIIGVHAGSTAWGDYDNDGDLDLLITGESNTGHLSRIYKNNGNDRFTWQSQFNLMSIFWGDADWGDYDNDGDLDILLSGRADAGAGNKYVSKIYRNDHDTAFAEQTEILLPKIYSSSVAWGDYDNDGDLDIIISGKDGVVHILIIYKNNGDNTFIEQTGISLALASDGSVEWGDYDNDGDLDILLSGWYQGRIAWIYKNNTSSPNTPPDPPTGLFARVMDDSVTFSWNRATDAETLQTGLSYNVYLYSESGDTIWSSMSDHTTGYRRIPAMGNAQLDSCWTIYGLTPGTYYWSVQSIDNSFAGSAFAEEQSFNFDFTEQPDISLINVDNGSCIWGDYDKDGDLDILLSGYSPNEVLGLYKNNGGNNFTLQEVVPHTVRSFKSTWGDYDNDGDLDILKVAHTYDSVSMIIRNNGDDTFTEQTEIFLPGVYYGTVDWGDYDNDGDLDILLTGDSSFSSKVSKIYMNNGNNSFTEQSEILLTGIHGGSSTWGDYDNDGDLDILLGGSSEDGGLITKIFKNNGDNTFSEQTGIILESIYMGSTEWGDYDNDGDLDILISGNNRCVIYRNNSDHTFTKTGIILTRVYNSCAAWGDYDNDGDLDVVLTGRTFSSEHVSEIYRNDGDSTFSKQLGIKLSCVRNSSIAWGDYDNDGDLDILLAGQNADNERVTKIYKNNIAIPNTLPDPPSGLLVSVGEDSVSFNWNKATDNETPQDGLSYNAYLYKLGGDTIWTSMSDIKTGYRKIPALGNAMQNTGWYIRNLKDGQYRWSVQAIDHAFAGSQFAPEQFFEIPTPLPVATDTSVCSGLPVPDLYASGDSIRWYGDSLLQNLIHSGNHFPTGNTDPGIHTYFVTQTRYNSESKAIVVRLTIQESPEASITDSTNILCYGQGTGQATVTPFGGIAPYTFQWDDALNTNDSTVSGLYANQYYHVTVTDSNQCVAIDSVLLSENELLTATFTDSTVIKCFGNTGMVTVTPSGGVAPYTYLWDDDMSTTDSVLTGVIGKTWYRIIVADSLECQLTDSIRLYEPTPISISKEYTSQICTGIDTGYIHLDVTGGTPLYSYYWSTDAITSSINGLTKGQYKVTVTDNNNCTAKDSASIDFYDYSSVDIGEDDTICPGDMKILDAGGGYTSYLWSNASTESTIETFETGYYWVEVTNNHGCTARDTMHLSWFSFPEMTITTEIEAIDEGDSTLLRASGAETYDWYPQGLVSSQIDAETWAFPSVNTMFSAVGINEFGCSDTAYQKVYVYCDTCPDKQQLHEDEGQFTHGCSERAYRNNTTCSWRIIPSVSPGKVIYISFDRFDIKPGDYLSVYDGQDATGTLIGTYDNYQPPDTLMGGIARFIELVTNDNDVGEGFQATYWLDSPVNITPTPIVSALKIYPNPFSNSTIIELPEPNSGSYTLILTDLSGKIHRKIPNISETIFELHKEDLSNGFYIVEMRGENLYRGRIIIE